MIVDQYFSDRNVEIAHVISYQHYYDGDPLSICRQCGYPKGDHGVLILYKCNGRTLDLCPGDWIIKDNDDKLHTCKKDDLSETIEKIIKTNKK